VVEKRRREEGVEEMRREEKGEREVDAAKVGRDEEKGDVKEEGKGVNLHRFVNAFSAFPSLNRCSANSRTSEGRGSFCSSVDKQPNESEAVLFA
jgi:hypothetical protein